MFTKPYEQAIQYLAENAPTLDTPTKFIKWAEDMANIINFIYSVDFYQVTVDLIEATKEAQDYVDD